MPTLFSRPRLLAVALVASLGWLTPAFAQSTGTPKAAPKTLPAFADDAELLAYLDQLAKARRERQKSLNAYPAPPAPAPVAAPMASAAPAAESAPTAAVATRARAEGATAESITNVQTQGVDEGGIVKVHGDHLVVLRRGRLFTVSVGGDRLQPKSIVDAYAPGITAGGAWYDEMLISGDTIVVIGYSYARGGTEIGLFSIDRNGRLTYRSTYHLRSNDYYSSRNYASRLLGDTLIFYTPLALNRRLNAPLDALPGQRRWHAERPEDFRRIAPANQIYRSDIPMEGEETLHTVTRCKINGAELDCRAASILGPSSRSFYVSGSAVYVWVSAFARWRQAPSDAPGSALMRLPLDGSPPTAIRTRGTPIDQMSFLESDDAHIQVLLRDAGGGDGMWQSETRGGAPLKLLRLPLGLMTDGSDDAPLPAYRSLPALGYGSLQNRYIGAWLLFGVSRYATQGEADNAPSLYAVRWDGSSRRAIPLDVGHAIERIEAMGGHALAVGRTNEAARSNDLVFTSLRLGRFGAMVESAYVQPNSRQGESRSHGFFYRVDGPEQGIAGLPILRNEIARPGERGGASILYLQNRGLEWSPLGTLAAMGSRRNDNCRASCVDWYGNARPIFLRGRIFALLGYEMVEGAWMDGKIVERRRVDAVTLLDDNAVGERR
jgi:hypothetical protein